MHKVLTILQVILLTVIAVAGIYVAYVFGTYHRIEDNLSIIPENKTEKNLPVNEELTAVTWNLGFGAYSSDFAFFMDGGSESRARSKEAVIANITGAAKELRENRADLMFLQEVDFDSTRAHHVNEMQILKECFPEKSCVFAQNYDSPYLFYPILQPHGASKSGLLTFADAKFDNALRISLPIEAGFRKLLDLDRCYVKMHIPTENGKTLTVYNLHLSAYTKDGEIAVEQIRILLADMCREREEGNYVMAAGDFNKDVWGDSTVYTGISGEDYSWAKPFPKELLPVGFTLVDSVNVDAPVLSCRDSGAAYVKGETYEVTLDAFIVSDNIQINDCCVLDEGFRFSDHNPVRMTFELIA